MARYILMRVSEENGMIVSYAPKLYEDWAGSGCHVNYSTATMRSGEGGMRYIEDMLEKFRAKHQLHMELYGLDNKKRLTGIHETSNFNDFSYGPGNRAASFRIPSTVKNQNGKGYIEDRRPASNIDPYVVGSIIFDTSVLTEAKAYPLLEHYRKWVKFIANTHIEKA